jgi:hypothetical protein
MKTDNLKSIYVYNINASFEEKTTMTKVKEAFSILKSVHTPNSYYGQTKLC